jgi:hypothetical protein
LPGSSPGEAVTNFLDPIKTAIECIGNGHLHHGDHPPLDTIQTATLNAGEGLKVRAEGPYDPCLTVSIELNFKAIHCPDDIERGPYRCRQTSYILALEDSDARELVAFHWHPLQKVSPEVKPHMHVGEARVPQLNRLHVPTPRTSVEDFLILAIESFGVVPMVDEATWRPVLMGSKGIYEQYRSWSERDAAPGPDDI